MLIDKATKAIAYGSTMIDKVYYGASYIWGKIKAQLVAMSGSRMELLNVAKESELVDFKIYGKSIQDGEPTPESPVEIESVENPVVEFSGKNLAPNDLTQWYKGYWLNGTFNGTGEKNLKNFGDWVGWICYEIPVEEGQTIQITSTSGDKIASGTHIVWKSSYGDIKNNYLSIASNSSVPKTLIVPKGAKALSLSLSVNKTTSNDDDYLVKGYQVEVNSVATEYEPYHEPQTYQFPYTLHGIPVSSSGNYTDESGQQWIADYVDSGEKKLWRMCEKYIPNLAISVGTSGTTFYGAIATNNPGKIDDTIKLCICDKLITCSFNERYSAPYTNGIRAYMQDGLFAIRLLDGAVPEFTTMDELQNWLDTNQFSVIYALASPIATDLTDAEVAAFKQMKTIVPTTVVSNDAGAHMEARYWCDLDSLEAQTTSLYNNDIKELIDL